MYRRLYQDTGLYQYKVIGRYHDITAKDYLEVQVLCTVFVLVMFSVKNSHYVNVSMFSYMLTFNSKSMNIIIIIITLVCFIDMVAFEHCTAVHVCTCTPAMILLYINFIHLACMHMCTVYVDFYNVYFFFLILT